MADSAGGRRFVEMPSAVGGVVEGRGVVFVVDARSIAVNCFICAAVSFCYRFISSIITFVELLAVALAAVSGILLRLVWLLLLRPPTELSSRLSCSKDFTYAVMAL